MTNLEVTWTTRKQAYTFKALPIIGTRWNTVGGNYVFAKETNAGWIALYAGQTENFKARFANHEKLVRAENLGATHIFTRVNNNSISRTNEEIDFVGHFKPILNEQLV